MRRLIENDNGTWTAEWSDDRTGRELRKLFPDPGLADAWFDRKDASNRLEACAFVLAALERADYTPDQHPIHFDKVADQKDRIKAAVKHAVRVGLPAASIAEALDVKEWKVFDYFADERVEKAFAAFDTGEVDTYEDWERSNESKPQGDYIGHTAVPDPDFDPGAVGRDAGEHELGEVGVGAGQAEGRLDKLQRQVDDLHDRLLDTEKDMDALEVRVDMLDRSDLGPRIRATRSPTVQDMKDTGTDTRKRYWSEEAGIWLLMSRIGGESHEIGVVEPSEASVGDWRAAAIVFGRETYLGTYGSDDSAKAAVNAWWNSNQDADLDWRDTGDAALDEYLKAMHERIKRRVYQGREAHGLRFRGDPMEHLEQELLDALFYAWWARRQRAASEHGVEIGAG